MKIHPALKSLEVPIDSLKLDKKNARSHGKPSIESIKASYSRFGQTKPIVALKDGTVIDGNGQLEAAKELGWQRIAAVTFLKPEDAKAYAIAINRTAELSSWNDERLAEILTSLSAGSEDILKGLGFSAAELEGLVKSVSQSAGPHNSLQDMFVVPPFSVLDSRQGYWKARKDSWLKMGIKSEVGRESNLLRMSDTLRQPDPKKRVKGAKVYGTQGTAYVGGNSWLKTGTSIFDPVLCELVYRWFCPAAGRILDPFAGGSVRGVVASALGFEYLGVDLRPEQVAENQGQAKAICKKPLPSWVAGDSKNILKLAGGGGSRYDLIFSCPPYFDLEVYSDEVADLSNMSFENFTASYSKIISDSCSLLKPNRFACFVVGDLRDKQGFYRNFVSQTIAAFEHAGCKLYNEAIFISPIGSLSIRAGRAFSASRKLGKTHQNVLVFFKGDPKTIKDTLPKVDLTLPSGFGDE